MKLSAQLKLKPTLEQEGSLRRTMQMANKACDTVSKVAWRNQEFRQFNLHGLTYYIIRECSGLFSQVVVRCISKVSDAYKLDKKVHRKFRPMGAISYDDRILSYKIVESEVSIWTVGGRQTIRFECGDHQRRLLKTRQGESQLAFMKGKWYLLATCNVEEPEIDDTGGVFGCDFGIVEICTTSEGKSYSGDKVKELRRKLRAHCTRDCRGSRVHS